LFVTSSCRPAFGSRLRLSRNGTADTRRAGLKFRRPCPKARLDGTVCTLYLVFKEPRWTAFRRSVAPRERCALQGNLTSLRCRFQPCQAEKCVLLNNLPAGIPSRRQQYSCRLPRRQQYSCRLRRGSFERARCRFPVSASSALPMTVGNASSTNPHRNHTVTGCQVPVNRRGKSCAVLCSRPSFSGGRGRPAVRAGPSAILAPALR
jgi:hypothetical protein